MTLLYLQSSAKCWWMILCEVAVGGCLPWCGCRLQELCLHTWVVWFGALSCNSRCWINQINIYIYIKKQFCHQILLSLLHADRHTASQQCKCETVPVVAVWSISVSCYFRFPLHFISKANIVFSFTTHHSSDTFFVCIFIGLFMFFIDRTELRDNRNQGEREQERATGRTSPLLFNWRVKCSSVWQDNPPTFEFK